MLVILSMISLLSLPRNSLRKKILIRRITWMGPMYIRRQTSVLKDSMLKEILFLLNSTARNLIWMRNFNTFSIILSLLSSSLSLTSSLLLTTKLWGSTFISMCVTGTRLSEIITTCTKMNYHNMHKYKVNICTFVQHGQSLETSLRYIINQNSEDVPNVKKHYGLHMCIHN